MKLSHGKWRRLQQATGTQGTFTVLAIDHRGPLRRQLAQGHSAHDVDRELAALKRDIVQALAPLCTAVLLDPEIGLPACVESGVLPGATGLLVALDTGSTGDPAVLKTGLVEGWNVERIARAGAAGVKLLVYYHPDAPQAAGVEDLVRRIGSACAQAEVPFYLEPLSYCPDESGRRLPSSERRRVVIETAIRLAPLGVDILKVEFPVQTEEETDPAAWREACRELSANCPVPWVLLSGGVSSGTFLEQASVACEAGASGVIAGRAIWNEAIRVEGPSRREFLCGEAFERLKQLRSLCDSAARGFSQVPGRQSP